jgi:hypothetical protein
MLPRWTLRPVITLLALPALVAALGTTAVAEMHTPLEKRPGADTRTTEQKIAIAMSAGPLEIAKGARIIDVDPSGQIEVLRDGANGFTCLPGRGDTHPPMCADQPSMQWFEDHAARRPKPTNTVPGVTYMLAGATQRSDSNPYDDSSPLIKIGPHWMIMWPFDPTTTGLPNSHRSTGAYIMWSGTPYAHLHVMGNPYGH